MRNGAPFPLLTALLATALLAALTAPAAGARPRVAPEPELSRPFTLGEAGYACFRIPALLSAPDGTLLAFAEARVADCADVGDIDLVLKRSADGGRTWGPLTVLAGTDDPGGFGNPAPVADPASGRLSLLFAYNPWTERDGERVRGPRELRLAHSTDNGASWRAGASLDALKPAGWTWISVGPGHGLALRHGPHAGRLVVPGDHNTEDGMAGAQLYYSDDGGLSWRMGAHYLTERSAANPGELALAERPDGTLYVNARSSRACGTSSHRLAAIAEDGGESFAPGAFAPVPDIDAPPVAAGMLAAGRDRLLLSAPARPGADTFRDRRIMAVRSSFDGGETWESRGTVITEGPAGYSDLGALGEGRIGLLYERATGSPHGSIAFTAFTPAGLDQAAGELILPRSRDASGQGNHAVVHGGAVTVADGALGSAMAFDGTDDLLRLINCPESLRVGAGDFTVTLWLRYDATDGALPLLWAYGDDPGERRFWLNAEPGHGRLRAGIDTGVAAATVALAGARNDGTWHHLVLTRRGGELSLAADGAPPATVPAPTGDLTPAGPFTLHIGAHPDEAELLHGALDDVRIHGRALSTAEADRVRAGDTGLADERVRLPFEAPATGPGPARGGARVTVTP